MVDRASGGWYLATDSCVAYLDCDAAGTAVTGPVGRCENQAWRIMNQRYDSHTGMANTASTNRQ